MVAHRQEFSVSSDAMTVPVTLWSSEGNPECASRPLLVVHDGPEYEEKNRLTNHLAELLHSDQIPAYNVALLAPDDQANMRRIMHYGASPAYREFLTGSILPEITRRAPTGEHPLVGMGASMGAVAVLHAADAFDGLFLQSTSIHHADYCDDEQTYVDAYDEYPQVRQFVERARVNLTDGDRLKIAMTCGDEPNLRGNRALFYALRDQGHELMGGYVPGSHSYESWGNALDPHLRDLLVAVAGMRRSR